MAIIKRVQALREMEIKETPAGKQISFSIKFINKSGEIVFFPRAIAAGLRYNMKLHMHRGIQPVDAQFNKTTHINPIHIDDIIQFNGNTVKL
jgi:hypothetical protein